MKLRCSNYSRNVLCCPYCFCSWDIPDFQVLSGEMECGNCNKTFTYAVISIEYNFLNKLVDDNETS